MTDLPGRGTLMALGAMAKGARGLNTGHLSVGPPRQRTWKRIRAPN